ncbi:amino acid permease [Simkania sp.]|uniref:amino acid permease n=1 Tax=Simkania sp. TaxID=34094 RepID=UPI003B51C731
MRKTLKTFQLVMINVIAVDSIRTLPFSAELGFSLVFFYFLAGIFFFIPSGLVAAELGTGWPNTGGIYVWVREAFGKKASMCVIWLNWIYNVVWYPTIMALIAGVFTYFFNPDLATNRLYMVLMILGLFWSATIVNLFGMRVSSIISTVGAIVGTLLPMVLIIILGVVWLGKREPSQIAFTWDALVPDITQSGNLAFFSSVLFGLLGLEMSATHAAEVRSPKKDYPRSVFISIAIILATIVFSSLAIAIVIPHQKLSLVTGILQAFFVFFQDYHIPYMAPIIAAAVIIGGLSGVSAWIIGPTKGMMVAAEDGSLPSFMRYRNRKGVPSNILILQGVIVSILCLAFVLMPTVNSSFWLLSQITAELALLVYIGLFAAGIRLRYKQGHVQRAFAIPGGKTFGMWLVGMCGILACLIAFGLGFIPPGQVGITNVFVYELLLIGGIVIVSLMPLLFRKKDV